MIVDLARMLRASKIRVGTLRASGAPAILLGVSTVIIAIGAARSLAALAPMLPAVTYAMIEEQTMVALIRTTMPDAQVDVLDRTGTMDHFDVLIRSNAFAGKSLLDRHRMVEKALKPARDDGRIHALAIRTELLET